MLPARTLAIVLLALPLAGCALPGHGTSGVGAGTQPTTSTTQTFPPLTFGGVVRNEADNATLPGAHVQIDLAQRLPCSREGFVWSDWSADALADGRFGPVTVPRPNSNDVAFFLHANASGDFVDRVLFIGPHEAQGDIGNLTLRVRPAAELNGTAPPGTLLALDDSPFPQLVVADGSGGFSFAQAPPGTRSFVAATDVPVVARVQAPLAVTITQPNGTGWRLEGKLVGDSGAPMAADVVAWNGTQLASAARAGENGVFVLPLPAHAQSLRIDARTTDGRFAGTLSRDVHGPPATRETIVMRGLC